MSEKNKWAPPSGAQELIFSFWRPLIFFIRYSRQFYITYHKLKKRPVPLRVMPILRFFRPGHPIWQLPPKFLYFQYPPIQGIFYTGAVQEMVSRFFVATCFSTQQVISYYVLLSFHRQKNDASQVSSSKSLQNESTSAALSRVRTVSVLYSA